MNINGLYEKKGWFYYQPPTTNSGSRPNAVALRTQDFQEAVLRCFEAMERAQLMAAAVDGRMDQAIDQYLKAKKAAREHGPKTSYTTGQTLRQISREIGNPRLSDLTEKIK